ncbi:MAG TPA: DUF6580 family putative transport protein [Pirellulales bacterium]
MKRELTTNLFVFFLLVAVGVGSRWIADAGQPTLSNFTALAAAGLFAGFYFKPRWIAGLVPLAIMPLSNLGLPKYNNGWEMTFALAMLLLPVALGWFLQRKATWLRIFSSAAAPAILFYLVTDLVFLPGQSLYPQTIAGQLDSYVAALPFLRNMLLGNLVYSALFFGVYWAVVSARLGSRTNAELVPAPVRAE